LDTSAEGSEDEENSVMTPSQNDKDEEEQKSNSKVPEKSGLIFVKENVQDAKFEIDLSDNSIMRTDAHFLKIFKDAGFEVIKNQAQKGMPSELCQIKIYVLRKA
jgi:hypothetical protein